MPNRCRLDVLVYNNMLCDEVWALGYASCFEHMRTAVIESISRVCRLSFIQSFMGGEIVVGNDHKRSFFVTVPT